MAYQTIFSQQIADHLVERIESELPGLLETAKAPRLVAHARPDALREYPDGDSLRGTLPAVLILIEGPKLLKSRVIGPVVEVEERFRALVIVGSEIRDEGETPQDLDATVEALTRVLQGDVMLPEADVFGASNTQQLTPLRIEAVEYDPKELRDLKKIAPGIIGAAIPVAVRTVTSPAS